MALPTATTPGYCLFRGKVTCVCLAEWLPVFERLAILRGLILYSLDIIQLTGDVDASAGVHAKGGAFDLKQLGAAVVELLREMGAPASWTRYWADNYHTHGVLSGCPHNSPAAYQITAQRDGYDGLGYLGRGGTDPYPDPDVYRDWKQGIAWAEAQIEELTMPTPAEIWNADIIASPDRTAENPTWAPGSYLRELFLLLRGTRTDVRTGTASVLADTAALEVQLNAVKAQNAALATATRLQSDAILAAIAAINVTPVVDNAALVAEVNVAIRESLSALRLVSDAA